MHSYLKEGEATWYLNKEKETTGRKGKGKMPSESIQFKKWMVKSTGVIGTERVTDELKTTEVRGIMVGKV